MFLVSHLVYWYSVLHLVSSLISQSLLREISIGKPTRTSTRYLTDYQYKISNSSFIHCKTMTFDVYGRNPQYDVDFKNVFPVVQINISGVATEFTNLSVYIDTSFCANVTFPPGLYMSLTFQCIQYLKGRMLGIRSSSIFHVCSLQVHSCTDGFTGPDCRSHCDYGMFGVGCSQACNCYKGSECDALTGHCPDGCQNAYGDENVGCIFKILDSPARNIDRMQFTPSPVVNIFSYPRTDIYESILMTNYRHSLFSSQLKVEHTDNCITVYNTSRLTLTVNYARVVYFEGVIVHHLWIKCVLPLFVFLLVDDKICGETRFLDRPPSSAQRYICQHKGLQGTKIQIFYITPKAPQHGIISMGICGLGILECATGFYGPRCHLLCHCMSTGCDSHTGESWRGLCYPHYTGSNCASYNIAYNKSFKIRFYSKEKQYNYLPHYQLDFFYGSKNVWLSWWSVEFDRIYQVNSITLHLLKDDNLRELLVEVYDSEGLEYRSLFSSKEFWSGFPCQVFYPKVDSTLEIMCPSVSRSLLVVMTLVNIPDIFAITDYKIWECAEGTFGEKCLQVCRCKNDTEMCDKITGHCQSGCKDGHRLVVGKGCVPLKKPGYEIIQPTDCHCNSGGCPQGTHLCTDGCKPGWTGLSCNLTCSHLTYGPDCVHRCDDMCQKSEIDNEICSPDTGICLHGCLKGFSGVRCEYGREFARPEDTSSMAYSTKVTIITLVICAIVILFGGFLCKFFWMKMNKEEDDMYKYRELALKRETSKDVNDQILRDHMDYHENYLKRDMLLKAQSADVDANIQFPEHISDKLMRKNAFDLKKIAVPKAEQQKPAGQGKPLGQDHEQQDSDVKVALWVLSQNFEEFIQRRKERLANYQGNILEIQESLYSIPKVDIEGDIHDLYDEIAPLELP
ncbi:platelet endothelial aggregation receptor 1 [Biomphalaria pfeifferi]|uniref:Platelet endothelial aggregation receptor 1 n=1 Tax=Biomphalaria pfeifferi TaxID=112525 RepID=A0AAD8BU36_BIOPF|nr:platelet endothelial aggregation receptor 1 [Biomphalaria pfeifferi]